MAVIHTVLYGVHLLWATQHGVTTYRAVSGFDNAHVIHLNTEITGVRPEMSGRHMSWPILLVEIAGSTVHH